MFAHVRVLGTPGNPLPNVFCFESFSSDVLSVLFQDVSSLNPVYAALIPRSSSFGPEKWVQLQRG